ncbi:MAG: hypothetical protein M1820_005992 [Bogoriella megaspora]|nr:MAG: hypothetical protein M1820_005992 [Bogoriella megaspora]
MSLHQVDEKNGKEAILKEKLDEGTQDTRSSNSTHENENPKDLAAMTDGSPEALNGTYGKRQHTNCEDLEKPKTIQCICSKCDSDIPISAALIEFAHFLSHRNSPSPSKDLAPKWIEPTAQSLLTPDPPSPESISPRLGFALENRFSEVAFVPEIEWATSLKDISSIAEDRKFAVLLVRYPFNDDIRGTSRDRKHPDEELIILSPPLCEMINKVVNSYPSISYEKNSIKLSPPYEPLFFHWDEMDELARTAPEHCKQDFECFKQAYQKCTSGTHRTIKELLHKSIIDFQSLWAIFKPGDVIHCLDQKGLPCLRVLVAVTYRDPEYNLFNDPPHSSRRFRRLCADMWSVGWDFENEKFQRFYYTQTIREFIGYIDIGTLPFYPIKYFKSNSNENLESFLQRQQQNGHRWKRLVSEPPSCQLYFPLGSPDGLENTATGGERVVVDENPISEPRHDSYDTQERPVPWWEQETNISRMLGGFSFTTDNKETPVMSFVRLDDYASLDNFDPKKTFSDLQAQLCPPTVKCYGLQSRKYFQAEVSKMREVDWEKDALKHLELDDKKKAVLCSLVQRHKKNSNEVVRDIIPNKGKGLIIVLHGPPGVGKTLTAETIAEHTKKPLYPINIGELTGSLSTVKRLEDAFRIAPRWDAIMLLDEADVLLESRSYEDLHRNGIVSTFLRMIEYYEGILFMTTNRIGTMDIAFQSRIHVTIKYDPLTPDMRERIWTRFIDRLSDKEVIAKRELLNALPDIREWELNGRQIRNVLSIAESTALNEARRRGALRYSHVETVANESIEFMQFFDDDHKERKSYAKASEKRKAERFKKSRPRTTTEDKRYKETTMTLGKQLRKSG